MPKATFPVELLSNEIEEHNRLWITEFRDNTKFTSSYYLAIEQFFKYNKFSQKPFNLFELDDFYEYIGIMIDNSYADNTIQTFIMFMSSFISFLTDKHPDLFSKTLQEELLDIRLGVQEKKYSESKPLNLIQLCKVREFIKLHIKSEYIFEILFQLGIQKKEFEICLPQYCDKPTMQFIKQGKSPIRYNNKILNLISKIENLEKFKVTQHMITYHLLKIEDYLKQESVFEENKTLTYQDILKTHELFMIKCPNCERKFEAIHSNWILTKPDFCNDYFLTCTICKGEPINE